jgi:hypothetical protein
VTGRPGDLVCKPRGVWNSFWYGLQMDVGGVPVLAQRHGLVVDPADAQLTPGE